MKKYEVVGIGNAIVDVFSAADDSFLQLMGIEKGIMQLVERDRGEVLYGAMTDRVQAPGGSVANTLAGLGNLGLKTAFIGRVHDDALGRFYAKTMAEQGRPSRSGRGTRVKGPPERWISVETLRCGIGWLTAKASASANTRPLSPNGTPPRVALHVKSNSMVAPLGVARPTRPRTSRV